MKAVATSGELAIAVSDVSKLYVRGSPVQAMLGRARALPAQSNATHVVALRDVSFAIHRGESVAIIGRNGSGKSSLLEVITGTLTPTAGFARTRGRVAALLELGSGFDPGLSGRENVLMNGLLLGLTKQEIHARFDEIVAFADIGDVLDRPVSTYSSGMVVRLAFSVQVALDPDILIVDEALSVGDFFFQQKCAKLIKDLRDRGVTLLFVSHDMALVRDLCSRAVLLERGRLVFDGEVDAACRRYYASSSSFPSTSEGHSSDKPSGIAESHRATTLQPGALAADGASAAPSAYSLGAHMTQALWSRWPIPADRQDAPATLVSVSLLDARGEPAQSFCMGDVVTFRVGYRVNVNEPVHVAISVKNRLGWLVTCVGTYSKQCSVDLALESPYRVCDVSINLDVEAGEYGAKVTLGWKQNLPNRAISIDETRELGPISVTWDYETEIAPHLGLVGLPCSVTLSGATQ
jgi:lipopolysaccharide transport system ATP-binding protein